MSTCCDNIHEIWCCFHSLQDWSSRVEDILVDHCIKVAKRQRLLHPIFHVPIKVWSSLAYEEVKKKSRSFHPSSQEHLPSTKTSSLRRTLWLVRDSFSRVVHSLFPLPDYHGCDDLPLLSDTPLPPKSSASSFGGCVDDCYQVHLRKHLSSNCSPHMVSDT